MISHSTYKKPVLLVGNGVRNANASQLVYKFAKKTNIPVVTTMNAVDLAQDGIGFGFIGTYGNRIANMMISECDLLISIGARLGLRQIGNKKELFAPKAKLIRVDIDQFELNRKIKEEEEDHLIDAKEFLEKLLADGADDYSDWKNKCFEIKEKIKNFDDQIGNLVIKQINSIIPENPIIAVDVGQNECWAAQSLELKGENGRILIAGGYGSMGCALPFAVGASIASNNEKVFCITGDGGLQMNIQELETIVREHLPIKLIVLNNQSLGKISEIQYKSYKERYAQTTKDSGYSIPDFEKVAKAYGIESHTIQFEEGLDKYKEMFLSNSPCLINVLLPQNTLLTPKVQWETGSIVPELDKKLNNEIKELLK